MSPVSLGHRSSLPRSSGCLLCGEELRGCWGCLGRRLAGISIERQRVHVQENTHIHNAPHQLLALGNGGDLVI